MTTLKIQDVILKNWKLFVLMTVIHDWYVQAEAIGANIDVMPDVPRTVSRQLSHDNDLAN